MKGFAGTLGEGLDLTVWAVEAMGELIFVHKERVFVHVEWILGQTGLLSCKNIVRLGLLDAGGVSTAGDLVGHGQAP